MHVYFYWFMEFKYFSPCRKKVAERPYSAQHNMAQPPTNMDCPPGKGMVSSGYYSKGYRHIPNQTVPFSRIKALDRVPVFFVRIAAWGPCQDGCRVARLAYNLHMHFILLLFYFNFILLLFP